MSIPDEIIEKLKRLVPNISGGAWYESGNIIESIIKYQIFVFVGQRTTFGESRDSWQSALDSILSQLSTKDDGPRWGDTKCEFCKFIGRYNELDLYWHSEGSASRAYARSAVTAEEACWPHSSNLREWMHAALHLARERGLIPPDTKRIPVVTGL